jgi:hypothetical protein
MAEKMGRPRGRPPGAKNRRTEEREAATAEAAAQIEQALGDAFQGDAHALLMAVYKNPANELPLRVDAAKAAIRYEKPALSSIDAKVDANVKATIRKVQRTVVDPRDQNPAGVPAPPEAG